VSGRSPGTVVLEREMKWCKGLQVHVGVGVVIIIVGFVYEVLVFFSLAASDVQVIAMIRLQSSEHEVLRAM
jgi:hypothetical protein